MSTYDNQKPYNSPAKNCSILKVTALNRSAVSVQLHDLVTLFTVLSADMPRHHAWPTSQLQVFLQVTKGSRSQAR